jgi:replicative DNA helicase
MVGRVPSSYSREPPNEATAPEERPRLLRLAGLLDEWRLDAEAAHRAHTTGMPRGPITSLPSLDRELGGALAPGVHVLHAGPGVGKSAFALQLAALSPFPALYLTAEMSALELLRRVTARVTSTFLGRLRSGELDPRTSLALARRAAAAAPLLSLADATQAWAPPDWIMDAAELVRGDASHLLLIVDSVHSWAESEPNGVAEYDALNAGLAALRRIARTLACPVLAIAERNRPSMKDGGLSAAAGSRKFEYGGESVLSLSRDKDAAPDAAGDVQVTLTLEKNRHGAPGKKIKLVFNGALQSFREAER